MGGLFQRNVRERNNLSPNTKNGPKGENFSKDKELSKNDCFNLQKEDKAKNDSEEMKPGRKKEELIEKC